MSILSINRTLLTTHRLCDLNADLTQKKSQFEKFLSILARLFCTQSHIREEKAKLRVLEQLVEMHRMDPQREELSLALQGQLKEFTIYKNPKVFQHRATYRLFHEEIDRIDAIFQQTKSRPTPIPVMSSTTELPPQTAYEVNPKTFFGYTH